MEIRPISQSGLNLYKDCPYKYKLKYIDRLQPIFYDTTAMDVGSYVHNAIDSYYKNNNRVLSSVDDILYMTYSELKKIWDTSLPAERLKHAYICLQNHAKFESECVLNGMNIKPLTEIEIAEDGFHGIIDYFNPVSNKAIDWKTGKKAVLSYNYRVQAYIYKVLVEKALSINLPYFYFFFLYPNEWRKVSFDTKAQKKIANDVEKTKEAIIESTLDNNFPKKPRTASVCKYCEYAFYCKTMKI